MQCNLHILIYILSRRIFRIFWLGVAVVKRSTLEMDSSWAILCGTDIQVGLGPQQVSVQIRKKLGSQEPPYKECAPLTGTGIPTNKHRMRDEVGGGSELRKVLRRSASKNSAGCAFLRCPINYEQQFPILRSYLSFYYGLFKFRLNKYSVVSEQKQ